MNWFYIDTHERGLANLGFFNEQEITIKSFEIKPGSLVSTISKKFPKDKIASADGIVVVRGPGSFSAIRAGVLIANLISRIFEKPLYGITVEDSENLSNVLNKISSGQLKNLKYADPIYDSEPNITMPKKI
jgi:tRNA A37 threonylcarbamoyladenosine modification protein TsaB